MRYMPVISILVPCFNAEEFIAEAIASVQAQEFQDWECIVVDDCSTDGSAESLKRIAEQDSRIVPIFLPVNGGASAARNAALDAARGDWVTLLDADDLYAPERLGRLLELANATQADMVFDNQMIAEFPATRGDATAFHWLRENVQQTGRDEFFIRSARNGRSLNPGYMKPMFARSLIESNALRYDPAFRSGQDYLFYANAFALDPKCYATNYKGYIYRRRTGSLSRSGGQHLRNHAKLSDEILMRHGARLPAAVHQALQRRRTHFLRGAALHDFRVAVQQRNWLAAFSVAAKQPNFVLGGAAAMQKRFLRTR